jgi:hypothetical protein
MSVCKIWMCSKCLGSYTSCEITMMDEALVPTKCPLGRECDWHPATDGWDDGED